MAATVAAQPTTPSDMEEARTLGSQEEGRPTSAAAPGSDRYALPMVTPQGESLSPDSSAGLAQGGNTGTAGWQVRAKKELRRIVLNFTPSWFSIK